MDGHNRAVIGGIYTRNTGRNLDQVPFFGGHPDPRHPLSAAAARATPGVSW